MPVTDPLPESNCEQGDVFTGSLDSLQVPKGNQSPVFVELCAGSAKLSDAVKQLGYNIIAVDHDKNRHTPRCKLVQLDLSHKHAWDMLDFLLQRVVIAGVLAPPCGTCSRARGIPMADGSKGPQPLRSAEHPLGIPSLNQRDQQRVFLANQIYKFCGEYVKKLHAAGIPWLFLLASLSICMHVRMDQRGRNSLPFCAAIETSTSSSFTAMDSTSIKLGELRQMELLAQPWRLNIPEHFVFDMLKFFMNCVNSGIFIHAPKLI